MFLLMLMLNILSAQEVQLEFNDWNYDTKIEIDSLNIKNLGLGIDTTLINPKSVNIHNLLIINDVEEERLNKYNLNYSSNILKINSKEIINNIKVIDLLGKIIFEESPNNTSFEKSINLQENLTFLILTINNKTYSQKLYNINEEFYKSPSVILNDQDTWYFTPYKEKYRDTTYTFQNYQLKDTLDIDLKRERYLVSISTSNVIIKRNYYMFSMNPANNEVYEENKDSFYERVFSVTLVLFETKYSDFNIYSICPEERHLYYGNGFLEMIWNNEKRSMNNTYIDLNNNNLSNFYYFNSTNYTIYQIDCDYSIFKYSLPQIINLDSLTSKTFKNELQGGMSFEYKMERQSGSYSWTEIKENISSLNGSTTTLTIKKLD